MPYDKLKRLGNGHFGEVILEHDRGLDRLCAAKYLPAGGPTRFKEAQDMLTVEHPNVVKVYSADDDQSTGMVVIRMEHHPDGSLEDTYSAQPRNVLRIVLQAEDALRGVQHLHSNDILHRDLKPANILSAADGRAVVSDFGLAREVAQAHAFPPIGYAAHLPPEAFAQTGQITTVTGDVFAMGVTLYRLLEGDGFIPTDLREIEEQVTSGKYPPNAFSSHVHDRLRRVVRKATHSDPARRYQSADEFRHALEAARPAVAWEPVAGAPDCWTGARASDGDTIKCQVVAKQGTFSVVVQRTRANGKTNRERRLEVSDVSRREALKHAQSVMNGYSQP